MLTQNNSNYSNFEFTRKKGTPGQSPSYSNSDIRQERKVSGYSDWTPTEFGLRRDELAAWVSDRWKTEGNLAALAVEETDEEDEDAPQSQPAGLSL